MHYYLNCVFRILEKWDIEETNNHLGPIYPNCKPRCDVTKSCRPIRKWTCKTRKHLEVGSLISTPFGPSSPHHKVFHFLNGAGETSTSGTGWTYLVPTRCFLKWILRLPILSPYYSSQRLQMHVSTYSQQVSMKEGFISNFFLSCLIRS